MADENGKCEHRLCTCTVDEDTDYCSPQCESAEEQGLEVIGCECDHAGCT